MAKGNGNFIGQYGINAPDPALNVSAAAGGSSASVSFDAPADVGGAGITSFRVQSNDGIGETGTSSPVTVSGLTNGTSYTFNVWAINPFGYSEPSGTTNSIIPLNNRGIFAGASSQNVIDYITISTDGNASDFGDLLAAAAQVNSGATGNFTSAVFAGGLTSSGNQNNMQYITIASTGNASSFGDLTNVYAAMGGHSSTTRAVYGGGLKNSGSNYNTSIEFITIASVGNATDFGDLLGNSQGSTGFGSSTRAIFRAQINTNVFEFITIASAGNSTDFGDSTQTTQQGAAAASSSTRGIVAGGYITGGADLTNYIEFIGISSTGNASDFGDLTQSINFGVAVSDSTKWVRGGGAISGASTNTMDDVTIASTGNATDFGDLTVARKRLGSGCGSHGGLQ